MCHRTRVLGSGLLAAALLVPATGPSAASAAKPIRGKLSKPGYTLIALAESGKARSVRVRRRFTLRPPARTSSLHLRAPNGHYAGPVVVRRERRGRRAIVGVRAGARLGRIRITRTHGRVAKRIRKKYAPKRYTARARRGKPIGNARNVGRVRARARGMGGDGRDSDRDGVPDLLDIDDDGDLVLDRIERARSARASEVTDAFLFNSNLTLEVHETVNANAQGLTPEQTDAALASRGVLQMNILPGDSAVLDCGASQSRADPTLGGLVYCSAGGTGRLLGEGIVDPPGFPTPCCDPDGDGLGAMTPGSPDRAPGAGNLVMFLGHGATSAQIGTGDLLIQRVTRGGVVTDFPATIQFIFATVPALVAYSDGHANSATVDYPVAGHQPGPPGPGTRENGLPVTAGPDGDVVAALTFWRPQRRPIPPEEGEWIDMGGLNHSAGIGDVGANCPQSAFAESDPTLRPLTAEDVFPNDYAGVRDLAPDRPADPANTFTYRLNLTRCLAAHDLSFEPGETRTFKFPTLVPSGGDDAEQYVSFTRR